jgi:endonuclease/exonuclease/phosphatase (EEP) superfamily protein YafD
MNKTRIELFPSCYTVFRSNRASVSKTRCGGVLIALLSRVQSYKRRYDLEYSDECVWVEILTSDGLNQLIVNHYFFPDTKPENIANYFRFLENNLDTHNFRVIMVGDFNAPGSTGKLVHHCPIPIITLNLREMRFTSPHAF